VLGKGFAVYGIFFMEKKKLLLVSVSTGIFLMLVIGASILIFSPPATSLQSEVASGVVPPGKIEADRAFSGVTVSAEGSSGETVSVIPSVSIVSATGEAVTPTVVPSAVPSGTSAARPVVTMQNPASETVETQTVAEASAESPRAVSVSKAAPASTPAPKPKPAATAVTSAAASKPAAVSKPAPAYWVQIGSYSQKSGADKAKENLSQRGLASVVSDSSVQGKIYYRVRVGPWVTRAEADYWLRYVKGIDGYENSQVWQSGI
jgi:DedD protein